MNSPQPLADARPDFLCIGAQKGGTSWLYDQLHSRPGIWLPPIKELHYFDGRFRSADMERLYRRMLAGKSNRDSGKARPFSARDRVFLERARTFSGGSADAHWYGALFAAKDGLISGEITPAYSGLPEEAVAAIHREFPDLRIVFLARDPVDRLWSHLAARMRRPGFRVDPADCQSVLAWLAKPGPSARSFPARTVRRWRRHFGTAGLYIGFFDQLRAEPRRLLQGILAFLGAPMQAPALPEHNRWANTSKPEMTPAVRRCLVDYFAEELRDCARELGGPACDWPARYGL